MVRRTDIRRYLKLWWIYYVLRIQKNETVVFDLVVPNTRRPPRLVRIRETKIPAHSSPIRASVGKQGFVGIGLAIPMGIFAVWMDLETRQSWPTAHS